MIKYLLYSLYKQQTRHLFTEVTLKELTSMNIRNNTFTPKQINYKGLQFRTKTLYWNTGDYEQKVRIPDLSVISKLKGTYEEKLKIALEGDIFVHCSCADYLYGGFQYIATELGYAIEKESRYPKIRNPKVDGSVCKHLNYLLNNINDFIPEISKDLETITKGGKNTKRIIH